MKKVFAILAVLSLLMVPCVSMAATMSDADLAAVTGQSGVTIGITSLDIALSLGALTWGDYDGFGATYSAAGYVNVLFYPAAMHIGVSALDLTIDVGTAAGVTAVQIGVASGATITVDAIIADIVLDGANGALGDYVALNSGGTTYSYSAGQLAAVEAGTTGNTANILGVFGVSNIKAVVKALTLTISAH